mmetsp:Transcript_2646/g.4035  ORF Transcript_2646/g.4035 Transcript_2646/m.4035 type:complete len:423 (+) Transcript_2646:871-2139(+)
MEKVFGELPAKIGSFTFKDYAPRVFQEIRRDASIDAKEYIKSVCHNNYIEFISNSKSGAFFFFSNDGRYMIKTIEQAESKCLLKMLQGYYLHLKSNPGSMISRFFGLHRVKFRRPVHGRRKYHFVIMQSVFHTSRYIHAIFDLKGSEVGRYATENDKKRPPTNKMTSTVLKDNDWVNNGLKLILGPDKVPIFINQLKKDSDFLSQQAIIDYSLLVGIHYPDLPDPRDAKANGGSISGNNFVLGEAIDTDIEKGSILRRGGVGNRRLSAEDRILPSNRSPIPSHTRHRRFNTWSKSHSQLIAVEKPTSRREKEETKKGDTVPSLSESNRSLQAHKFSTSPKSTPPTNAVSNELMVYDAKRKRSGSISTGHIVTRKPSHSLASMLDKVELDPGISAADYSKSKQIYYIGIIDILIQFGYVKRGE